jgi:ABC-type antimicrobial peptide transport system permease subunit
MEHRASPPQIFLRFFRWFCHPKLHRYIEGDLIETYDAQLKAMGKTKADLKFIIDVLLLFRPGIIKPREGYQNLNTYGMYKNYLKTGWRNLAKNKVFSFINISGLSLGLTCSILIALWVRDEYNIDSFHEHGDRIFAVTSCEYSGGKITYGGYDTPGLLGEELKKVLPEVEYAFNYSGWGSYYNFSVGDKKTKLPGDFAGADFFKIFSYPLLLGNRETALATPESIAISRKMATNLFGSPELAMDKAIRCENYRDLKVTAVFEDLQDNVSAKFEYIMSWEFFIERNGWLKDWHNSGPSTVVMLREHVDPNTVIPKIQHFIKKYDKEYSEIDRLELGLQPFEEKYLNSKFENGKVAGGRIEYVQLFRLVAIFILLIACINFMNLSTARAIKRAKEIGVRKVNGAIRTALISQFMLEAFLFTAIAISLAIILIQMLLPQFNLLTGKNIQSPLNEQSFWLGMIALTLIAGVISGSYPALLLSSFKPISVLKNNLKMSSSSVFFRKGLVVFQFALSMIFIVGMIVISNQVDFILNKNLGFQKNNLVYLPLTGNIASKFDVFKHEALQIPGIINISNMSQRPVELENTTGSVMWEGKDMNTRPVFTQAAVGYDFIKTMQATLLMGRDFSPDFADSSNYIINETALKIIGYKDPIGMPLTFWDVKGTIVGVVKDFHFNSLHVKIEPLVLRLNAGGSWGAALIRTAPEKTLSVLPQLEKLHQKLNPDFVFAHQFADEEYAYSYQSEQVIKQLSRYFAFLAIFISSLGLLGLVIFTAEQRTKEVGIRKVLGANVAQIVTLLSKDFMKLVIISTLLSSPVAYYFMNEWLQGFEYSVGIQWWVFGIAAAGAITIALLTVSFQAIRAAMVNPVNSLKSE